MFVLILLLSSPFYLSYTSQANYVDILPFFQQCSPLKVPADSSAFSQITSKKRNEKEGEREKKIRGDMKMHAVVGKKGK